MLGAGLALLGLLLIAPLVMAHLERMKAVGAIVVNRGDTYAYHAKQVGETHDALYCFDSDGGFKPHLMGTLHMQSADRNGDLVYFERCLDNTTKTEFACGKDVNHNGNGLITNYVYAYKFNCADINKTCFIGWCV